MSLSETLRALADQAPTRGLPAGLFDRARRRRRRRWAAAGAAVTVLAVFLVGVAGIGAASTTVGGADAVPGLPDVVADPPWWTADLDGAATGPASVVFWGDAVPEPAFGALASTPMAVVGLRSDVYRLVHATQPSVALSPDGTQLATVQQAPGAPPGFVGWRTEVRDLVTGQTRVVATDAIPLNWSTDGRHLVVVRPHYWPGGAPTNPPSDLVTVLSWPSAQVEWQIRVARPQPVEGETSHFFALSPDGSKLAVTTSQELLVYDRSGTVLWRRPAGDDLLAGPAAWTADGRLTLIRQAAPTTATPKSAPAALEPVPWRLLFVDAATGEPVASDTPGYPLASAVPRRLNLVAWRGDTAYVTTGQALVRLAPGAPTAENLLSMPAGVMNFAVPADFVDQARPATSAQFGLNLSQVGQHSLVVSQPLVIGGAIVWFVWWRRRRRAEHFQLSHDTP